MHAARGETQPPAGKVSEEHRAHVRACVPAVDPAAAATERRRGSGGSCSLLTSQRDLRGHVTGRVIKGQAIRGAVGGGRLMRNTASTGVCGGCPHLDGQHLVRVALQHLHGAAVADVLEAHAVGRQDLVAHLYSVLLRQTAGIQPETGEGGVTGRWARSLTWRGGGGTYLET